MPKDQRGRLKTDPFSYRVSKDGKVFVTRGGRSVGVLAGARAIRLRDQIAAAANEQAVQLLLARVTGNYRRKD